MIDDLFKRAAGLGATDEELDQAKIFLLYRQQEICQIVSSNAAEFKAIEQLGILI